MLFVALIIALVVVLLVPGAPTVEAQTAVSGEASAWGHNGYGQLGDGTTTDRNTPVQAGDLTDVKAAAAGALHSLAAKNDGTAWAGGYNGYGQLGDGSTNNRTTPVQVSGLTDVEAVAAGAFHSLAVKSDGTVWAWGYNGSGQLGDGTTTRRTTPVQVRGLTDVKAVSAGGHHSLAVKNDGTVWAWGGNSRGQLGNGATTKRTTPVRVRGLTGVKGVAAGGYHSLAAKSDGAALAWGYNSSGQLGDGTTTRRTTPVRVRGLTNVEAVSAGDAHSLAAKNDGAASAWGYNGYGQLGDGTTAKRTTPVEVSGLGVGGADAVSAGGNHSLAMKIDGTALAWGWNGHGQLGNGTTTDSTTPVEVSGLTRARAIAAGSAHNLAIEEPSPPPPPAASAGEPDASFDSDGKTTTGSGDSAYAVAVQPDGKIIAAGYAYQSGSNSDFTLIRYNPDGSLDTSFGGDGTVSTDFFGSSDGIQDIAIQPDGKVVAVGYAYDPNATSYAGSDYAALARYNPDGSLDTSFSSDGLATEDFGDTAGDVAYGVAIQPDGKIVTAGFSGSKFALARYSSDGSLDTSFNGTGTVTTDLGDNTDGAFEIEIQPDGKIIAGGTSYNTSSSAFDFALVRYNPEGSLDTSFNGSGKVITDLGGTSVEAVQGLEIQSDGKIVAVGPSYDSNGNKYVVGLARYNANGSLDTSSTIGSPGSSVYPSGAAVQADDKIVVAGEARTDTGGSRYFTLLRYNADGSLDTSFGDDGFVFTAFGGYQGCSPCAEAYDVAIQPDQEIVAAGTSYANDGLSFAVARYRP